MFALLCIVVVTCSVTGGVTAHPHPNITAHTHPTTTTPRTTATTTTEPTTPPICQNQPKRCPSKASLIADFISKSKYHFKALQYDHQGYYRALKWNLDMAFKSLEGQFGNLIADVQHDMKKQNDALKSQNAALKSQLQRNLSAVKDEITNLKTDVQKDIKDQFTNVQNQIDALKLQNADIETQNTALKSQLTRNMSAVKDEVSNLKAEVQQDMKDQFANVEKQVDALKSQNAGLKSQLNHNMSAVQDDVTKVKNQNTALQKQMTDGLKKLGTLITTLSKSQNQPKRCPSKASLIEEFISKSKYHFKSLQYDHQGYYRALKWNLDMAFKSLEGQFGNLIADVQHDMKKQNDALKSENAALKSQLTRNMSAVKDEVTNLKTDVQKDTKDQFANVQNQIDALNLQNADLKTQLNHNMSAVKDEVTKVKNQNTALKKQMADGLKKLTDYVTKCVGGKWVNGVCYKILRCSPSCSSVTAKQMCTDIGATLAPLRTHTIFSVVNAYKKELGIGLVHIDGSDAASEGTWLYHDRTPMGYTNWYPGNPAGGTNENTVVIYLDKMHDVPTYEKHGGVACAWE